MHIYFQQEKSQSVCGKINTSHEIQEVKAILILDKENQVCVFYSGKTQSTVPIELGDSLWAFAYEPYNFGRKYSTNLGVKRKLRVCKECFSLAMLRSL